MANPPGIEVAEAENTGALRLSRLAATARARAHLFKTRCIFAALGAIIMWVTIGGIWAAPWFVAVVITQAIDAAVWRPFENPDRPRPLSRMGWFLLCATCTITSTVFSILPALMWSLWGVKGTTFAMIWLCGSLLHVTMHMHHEFRTFVATNAPNYIYFIGLPLASLVTGAAPGRDASLLLLFASLMYVSHMVVVFREYRASSTDMLRAKEHARRRQESAEQANDAKSTFLANMSHEIRTPMNGILGMAAALEKSELRNEQRQQLKTISECGDHLMTILNDLLDFSKIEANRIEIEQTLFQLSDVARRVESLHRLRAEEKGLSFKVEKTGDFDVTLVGDTHRIVQILHNLVQNSIKFTKSGSITVSFNVSPKVEQTRTVTIEVADTGIGVPAEKIDQLFDAFAQADVATTRKYGGTGLGLSIVKGLVEIMSGSIKMTSTEGGGSRTKVELPLLEGKASAQAAHSDVDVAKYPMATRLKILAADDNVVNQTVLKTFLAQRDHEVKIANNGLEAIDAYKRGKFDVVLMDISMPVLDGIEALRQIRFWDREKKLKLSTPVIAVSAHAMSHQIDEYISSGFSGYLTKPIRDHVLHEEIDRVMADQRDTISLMTA